MKRLLHRLLDLETLPGRWDVRVPWPACRLEGHRKITSGGVEYGLDVYRLGAFHVGLIWWRGL